MKRILIISLTLLALVGACSSNIEPIATPEPVVEEIVYEQVVDNGKIYTRFGCKRGGVRGQIRPRIKEMIREEEGSN